MPDNDATITDAADAAKSHFSKAVEEAKIGAQALAEGYRDKIRHSRDDLAAQARTRTDDVQAKADGFAADVLEKATQAAYEGKTKTSQALVGISNVIDENATLIDEKVGPQYGDYVRTATQSLRKTADKLEGKSFEELASDTREYVRTSPWQAVGMAVFAGYLIGRIAKKR